MLNVIMLNAILQKAVAPSNVPREMGLFAFWSGGTPVLSACPLADSILPS
jgi:hypothetical protein